MISNCLICKRIALSRKNKNPYFVKELKTGLVVIADRQFYRGYTLFLCKVHAEELHQLNPKFQTCFLQEMALLSEAVHQAFNPHKLNIESLGNSERHLHWHIIPRYRSDPHLHQPIWVVDKKKRYAEKTIPSQSQLRRLKSKLLEKLNKKLAE